MKNWIFIVVGASLLWAPGALRASSFASEVIDYEPGEGFAKVGRPVQGSQKRDPSLVRRRA